MSCTKTSKLMAIRYFIQRRFPEDCRGAPNREAVGAPGRTRTCDPRLRRPVLYPTELRARVVHVTRATRLSGRGGLDARSPLMHPRDPVIGRTQRRLPSGDRRNTTTTIE